MRTIFIDPHSSDFVFTPVSFYFAKKRALRKYKYLEKISWDAVCISYTTSSLPRKLYSKLPNLILCLLVFLECLVWKRINKQSIISIHSVDFSNSNVFFFGYKNAESLLPLLVEKKFSNTVYIHLSHYHTFDIPSHYFQKLNIVLCFDNDINGFPYFVQKFPSYSKQVEIVPFQVNNVFFTTSAIKKFQVAVTGTFHRLPSQEGAIPYRGVGTLHPIRLDFSERTWPTYVKNRLSQYDSDSSFLYKIVIGQRRYFKFNILDFYRESSHAFVGGEGTGAIAIGTLEAMAAGCRPFLSYQEARGLLFDVDNADVILYSDIDDLDCKIRVLEEEFDFSSVNVQLVKAYSYDSLIERGRSLFEDCNG